MSKLSEASLFKRVLAAIITCAMVCTLMPTYAFAADGDSSTNGTAQDATASQTVTLTTGDDEETSTVNESSEDAISTTDTASSTQSGETTSSTSSSSQEQAEQSTESSTLEEAQLETTADKEEAAIETAEEKAVDPAVIAEAIANPVSVTYRAHVQRKGWTSYVKDGAIAGTTGKSLRTEAINVKLDFGKSGLSGGIKYRVHAQNNGWMDWAQDGALGGTFGKSLRLEAMQIALYGDVANVYDVYYSMHVQGKGWMAWAKNGATAGTAGQSRRVEAVKIVLVPQGEAAPSSDFVNYGKAFDGGDIVNVQAHVQRKGWMNKVGNGATAGTTGKSLRLEALNIDVNGLGLPGSVLVASHIQGSGWTGFKSGFAGTIGRSKRLEAVKMKLSGSEIEDDYDIYYRVHVSNLGWMNWACNGAAAGTQGMSARVEAIQVQLVKKGQEGPSSKSDTDEAFLTGTSVVYKAHCQSYGWRGAVKDGQTAGTTGQSKRLEAFTAELSGGNVGGSINTAAYVSGSGWQSYVSNGAVSGTTGSGKAIEAFKVTLSGRVSQVYNVYYRAHVADAGWLGWACNGERAGAPGVGKRVEAIQIRLMPKGQGAPGSTANHVVGKDFFNDAMTKKAQGYSSSTGWLIMVDDSKTTLGVYRGSQGHWSKYDMWRVSTGAAQSPSVHGVFSVGDRGYSFGYGHGYTCYYWVSWNGAYLFHSIKYNEGTFDVQDARIGEHISGGCVRMPINKAKWIYDNIPSGTTVVVY